MGSGNSRNAAVSSTSKQGNTRQRTGRRHLFYSRCFCPFSDLADNASNTMIRDRKCGRHIAPATRARVQQETNSGKQLNTENVKSFESRDLYESISSTDYNERSRRRHFIPVSNASSSSMHDSIVPELEPSTSFHNESSTRGKVIKRYENNYGFNLPNSNADHSTVQSRTRSSESIEAYSTFARRLRKQCSNVDLNQRINVDHSQNGSTMQQMHESGLCASSETRPRSHRVHSVQTRQGQYASLSSNGTELRDSFSESSSMTQNDYMGSRQAMSRNNDQHESILRRSSSMRLESREARRIHSRYGTPEQIERNASIRRIHSVEHIQDRMLRQESSEGLFTMVERDSMDREMRQHNRRRLWDSLRRSSSYRQVETQVTSEQDQFLHTLRSLSDNNRRRSDEIYQINQNAITDNGNLIEQRSLFLEERRRRARSQVRALQRLSNNFGNLSAHERSCILAGRYHTGRCSCQNVARTDDSNTRASISRIIMLAEALFEVLDEIHSQSMSLSSRASAVSLGPFPAPDYVVESMPVRIYKECEIVRTEECARCYVCLMEYEEGDHMRVLPCHHEFHLTCIDKWLKEIHRVCPLCRGNVCDIGFTNHLRVP